MGGDPHLRRQLATSGVVFIAASTVFAALAYVVLAGDVFPSIDAAVKFIQASVFRASGFRSTVLPYPAAGLDPEGLYLPFDSPYVFRDVTGSESIFPSAFAMLASLVVGLGPDALRALSIVGAAAAVVATAWLPDRGPRWAPAALMFFATPLWFHATSVGESTIALAASTWAFVAARRRTPGADLTAGLLLGAAAVFRDESLLLVPGLLYMRWRLAGRDARLVRCLAAVAAPVLLMALVDWAWLARPPLAHLRHAVPLLNAMLPRSRAVLPHLAALPWSVRYNGIVHYWWLGGGTWPLALGVAAALALAFALRERTRGAFVVMAIVLAAAAFEWRDLSSLVFAPRWPAGLLRLSPFMLFAFLPTAPGASRSSARSVAAVTTLAFTALICITLTTLGGKGLGPRLTLGLWPLVAVSAWDGLMSWWCWRGPRLVRFVIVAGGALLIAGSALMEAGVALPAWAARTREDARALSFIRQIPDSVIVLDDDVDMQLVGAEFFSRRVMFVANPGMWAGLGTRLSSAGESRFLVVSRNRTGGLDIPPYHLADQWTVSRYWVGRWVR